MQTYVIYFIWSNVWYSYLCLGYCLWYLYVNIPMDPMCTVRVHASKSPIDASEDTCALSFMAWHWRQIRDSRISMRGPRLSLRFHEGGVDGVERHLDDNVVRPKVRHDVWCMDVYICLHSGLTLRFLRGERVWRTICCSCVLSQFHWWSGSSSKLKWSQRLWTNKKVKWWSWVNDWTEKEPASYKGR